MGVEDESEREREGRLGEERERGVSRHMLGNLSPLAFQENGEFLEQAAKPKKTS